MAKSLASISHWIIGRPAYHNSLEGSTLGTLFYKEPFPEYISKINPLSKAKKPFTKRMPSKELYRKNRYTYSISFGDAHPFPSLASAKEAIRDLSKAESEEKSGEEWKEPNRGFWRIYGIPRLPMKWVIGDNQGIFYRGFLNKPMDWIHKPTLKVPFFGIHTFTHKKSEAKEFLLDELILYSMIMLSLKEHFLSSFSPIIEHIELDFGQDVFNFFNTKVIIPNPLEAHEPCFGVFDLKDGEGKMEEEMGEQIAQSIEDQIDPTPLDQGVMEEEPSLVLPPCLQECLDYMDSRSGLSFEEAVFGSRSPRGLPLHSEFDLDWMEEQTVELYPSLNDLLPDPANLDEPMLYFSSPYQS